MRIESVGLAPCIQRQEDPGWTFARGGIPQVRGWVVRIVEAGGTTGYGYAHALPQVTGSPEAVPGAVEALGQRLVGRDTDDLAALCVEMEAALAHAPGTRAGLEMALYDLVARGLGTPVGTLLGGRMRAAIPMGRLLALKPPEAMADAAAHLAAEGYGTLKIKLSGEVALDAARIAAVRAAVGPDVRLTLDPNQAYSAKGFLGAFDRFQEHAIALVEQPVPASDYAGLALLTARLPVPVEADESAASLADVQRLAATRMVDVVNLKVPKLGGVRATLAAIAVAEAAGIGVRFGAAFGPSLLQAFSAHLAAGLARMEHACELAEHLHLLDDPFTPLPVVGGVMAVPTGTGTGVATLAYTKSH